MGDFRTQGRPYGDPALPGKMMDGKEWWACDPYPTWYRWEEPRLLLVLSDGHEIVYWDGRNGSEKLDVV